MATNSGAEEKGGRVTIPGTAEELLLWPPLIPHRQLNIIIEANEGTGNAGMRPLSLTPSCLSRTFVSIFGGIFASRALCREIRHLCARDNIVVLFEDSRFEIERY